MKGKIMKTQKRIHLATVFISLFLCGSLVFYGFQAIGEEWTAEQKEVWKVVEADIEFFKQGDLEGLSASRHDDAVLWWSNSASPFDKRWSMMYYKDWFDNDRPVNFESEPLAIKIIGNVAIVFYTSKFSQQFPVKKLHKKVVKS
jgi:hypothetical protein